MQRASEIKVSSGEAIIFTCRDGAVRSGMACVLSYLIEKLENCVCLTVPLVVCSVKSARPGAFPTVEQYKDVYQMLETALLYLHNVE
ncbi:unnamed protein product [Lymnaea stagnalis]|uniref:Tyrosine specific protein phosphatases domain-containing protein n=1 Tax=Lymnaea stagnalis TaxID=6523 RepID=A0AAV2HK97_LYMST